MINITYIILAHDSPAGLIRLINTLRSKSARFVIHVDKSAAIENFLAAFERDEQVMIMDDRCLSRWGSFGLVQATLNAMAYVVNHISKTDRIILLSGKDYPIKSVEEIELYFDKNRESVFIEYFKIPYEKWYAKGVDRFPNFCEINETMNIYGGSQWWSFPIKVARFILVFLDYNPDYLAYFKMVTIPDESFFQTLLHNCGENFIEESLVCDNLRLIKWDPPYLHPRILGVKDFPLIQQSHAMFARKFDENFDIDVLDLIDKNILYSVPEKYVSNVVNFDLGSVNQVVLFLTNKNDPEIIKQFNKLKRETGDHASVKMLYHRSPNETIPDALSDDEIFVFTDDILNELGYEPFIGSKLDGSNHFPLIKFFRQYPDYDFYWYVEDDLRCLQGWNTFFSYFLVNQVSLDFIASHVRDFQDEPEWHWWKSLCIEDRQPDIDLIRSFNPIFRISRSALRFIDKCHTDGYSGHFEVLLPSLLKSGGYTFAEFGGEGKYVLPGCQNFFYKAADAESTGSMKTGSIRYRPLIQESEIREPLLYHPVKLQTIKKNEKQKQKANLIIEEDIGFSVIMPTYNQAHFIRRAIVSLFDQIYKNWELIIINDGCRDETEFFISEYINHPKITYIKNIDNKGLGYALNQGLEAAKHSYIAYLPSDDFYYKEHLYVLSQEFKKSKNTILAYTRARSEIIDSFREQRIGRKETKGIFDNHGIQLVQSAHKIGPERWYTREDIVTSNLFDMFFIKLVDKGDFCFISKVTCNWTMHAQQRHKYISLEFGGSIHKYKQYYGVNHPIKVAQGYNKFFDETIQYENFRESFIKNESSLKILLVGELSYNLDRIYAFEQKGHQLYGLWAKDIPSWSNTGPLPFGNVVNIPYKNWIQKVKEIEPDIIYGLLNYGGVNLAHEVLSEKLDIPFVWHFKEGPSVCMQDGIWQKLIDLYQKSDGKIFINPEAMAWYSQFITLNANDLTYILDGDQPKSDYFTDQASAKLSTLDGQIHTVVVGRMVGMSLGLIEQMAINNIHLHAYSGNGQKFNSEVMKIAPDHFHIHANVQANNWSLELSKYDAGWLHYFESQNGGDLLLANWDDLNLPCKIGTYAAAGLPMIQYRNEGHKVAVKNYLEEKKVTILFDSVKNLALSLKDFELMDDLRMNIQNNKLTFSFDYNVDGLIKFFREVIAKSISNEKRL